MLLKTMYEKTGGDDFVGFLADDFTHRVLSDSNLARLYEGYDFPRLAARHKEWVTHVLGGKSEDEHCLRYVNKSFVEERGISDVQYKLITEHLIVTLSEFDIPDTELSELRAYLIKMRDICLHRKKE